MDNSTNQVLNLQGLQSSTNTNTLEESKRITVICYNHYKGHRLPDIGF